MPVALIVVLVLATLAVVLLLELRGQNSSRRLIAAVLILALAASTAYVVLESDRQPPETAQTPAPTRTPDPTPSASERPTPSAPASVAPITVRFEVALQPGVYTLFRLDADGAVEAERSVRFDRPSMAPVDRIVATNGLVHWRTVVGGFTGLSYIPGRSGEFDIREVVRWPDGTTEARAVDPES